ncbi:allophanate hydrolase [Pigmentiphaga aceris]|uniref:Allophanate hydrolase n=1 Tax=Pigmentiphaga aceris TaxID=1940612 RepID=A0A5C0ATK8_9BURK|nr:allophanate hydrolase [Pigmentiphaga aceris]QEI05415.1 allophanate hydrolase [Pigmentiphaga aceris]
MPHPESIAQRLARFNTEAELAPANIWIDRKAVAAGADSGPLAGLLAAVKDNIDVAGFPTTAACPSFAYEPTRSATVVERLLAAGASVVGKTNLDQFACGLVGTRSPYGPVQNAFKPEYVSGGSSSGSAVAVALGLVDVSYGTDTAGSGRVPAGLNNIVGLKPSRGLMSTRGVVPASQHIDCVSIFARTVPQAIEVLMAVAGHDPECPYSRHLPLDPAAMPEQFRFGLPNAEQLEFFGDKQAQAAFDAAVVALEGLSGTASRIDYAPMLEAATALYEDVWVADRYAAIREFFDTRPDEIDPTVRTIIGAGQKYVAADVFTAMGRMGLLRQYADSLWKDIDVLVVPTAPTAHTIAAVQADPIVRNRELGYYTNFVNLLDLSAIAVPASIRPDGLPFGITLIGPSGSELRLADLAQRFHQQTGLTLGATGEPLPAAKPIPRVPGSTVKVAVVGAHLAGLPLNSQLLERGARLLSTVKTAPHYRFYALAGTVPPKPGMLRVAKDGAAIEAEVWEMPMTAYGSFVAGIPGPLGIGSIELEDGSRVQGFLCEASALEGAEDISEFGGWRAYLGRAKAAA